MSDVRIDYDLHTRGLHYNCVNCSGIVHPAEFWMKAAQQAHALNRVVDELADALEWSTKVPDRLSDEIVINHKGFRCTPQLTFCGLPAEVPTPSSDGSRIVVQCPTCEAFAQ